MKKNIYKLIFCRLMGWKVTGDIDSNIKKCVYAVVPHTSWHDFYIGILTRGVVGIEMNFVGKKELFMFPFGYYFRYMGGAPIDRSGNLNNVDSIVQIFNNKEIFRLGISPEGTRKKVSHFKTGFYYIAKKANVPIIPVAFDFGKKEVNFGNPIYTSDSIDTDFAILQKHFVGVVGKIPENGFTVV